MHLRTPLIVEWNGGGKMKMVDKKGRKGGGKK
jgi:hypothetical protein